MMNTTLHLHNMRCFPRSLPKQGLEGNVLNGSKDYNSLVLMSIIYPQHVTGALKCATLNTSNKEKMWIPAAVSAGQHSLDFRNKSHVKKQGRRQRCGSAHGPRSSRQWDSPPCSSCSWGSGRPSSPGGARGCRLRRSDPSRQTSCGTGNPFWLHISIHAYVDASQITDPISDPVWHARGHD